MANKKIKDIQRQIKEAIDEISKRENVSIAYKIDISVPNDPKMNEYESRSLGFTRNIVGFEFTSGNIKHKVKGKSYKFPADRVKTLLGGDKGVNRVDSLNKIFE